MTIVPLDPKPLDYPFRGSVPALVITLAIEAAPRVTLDCLSDSEHRRLADWLNSSHELCELAVLALELEEAA